jgi:transcriptional regulator with XRE-family HTH domain
MERAKTAPGAFTLAAIASRLGVTESAVSRWERGINRPTKRHQRALARVLGVTVDELTEPLVRAGQVDTDLAAERAAKRLEWARKSTAAPSPAQAPPSVVRRADRPNRP